MGTKKKIKKGFFWKKLLLVSIIVLPLLLAIAIKSTVWATFSVSAKTEVVEFCILDDNISKIPLIKAEIYEGVFDDTPIDSLFEGSFKPSVGSLVKIERISNSNYVSMQVEGAKDTISGKLKPAGALYGLDDEILKESNNFIEFIMRNLDERIDKGETMIFPITGNVKIGRAVNYETYGNSTAILRKGEVVVIGKPLLGEDYYKSSVYNLNIGDQFEILEENSNDIDKTSKAYGFSTINEKSGMLVAYKVVGERGKITSPGPISNNSGYIISTSLMSKFLYDPIIKGISLAIVILTSIAAIHPMMGSIYFSESLKKKKKK